MHVWNVPHAICWKYRTQKWCKKYASVHHCTTLSGFIFATRAHIDNRKKFVKQQYLPHMSLQYGELRPTSGSDDFVSLEDPSNFNGFRVLAALLHSTPAVGVSQTLQCWTRGRHLYSAGRPSRWASAHILVIIYNVSEFTVFRLYKKSHNNTDTTNQNAYFKLSTGYFII